MTPDHEKILRVLDDLLRVTPRMPQYGAAEVFHRYIHKGLEAAGFTVEAEHEVRYRRVDQKRIRRGFVDLIVTHPAFAAIELDNVKPRFKSLTKLNIIKEPGLRIAICRRPPRRAVTWRVGI